jgi:hypothetical protein
MVSLLDQPTGVSLMAGLLRRFPVALLAAFASVLLIQPTPAKCCPFCSVQGQTLTGDVSQASMVVVGTPTNARLNDPAGLDGTTDITIEKVIKSHESLIHDDGKVKTIQVNKYIPPDKKYKFLLFIDVYKGKNDPYRGVAVKADFDIATYLEGAVAVKDAKPTKRLAYFFKYLDSPEIDVSNDAYKEFGYADYKDYRDMAKDLPPDTLAKWLKDPNTPSFRFGLYASMLGHCGKAEHAKLLHEMLEDKKVTSGVDGILAGYVLLQPEEGWKYVRDLLKDEKKEFTQRYAALRTARFFHDSRPDVISHTKVIGAVALLLDQSDIADLAIEDMRKWGCWDMTEKVLELYGKSSHDVPIIRRSILRFALAASNPKLEKPDAKAVAFVADLRKKDPEMVEQAEELLRLETTPVKPATGK